MKLRESWYCDNEDEATICLCFLNTISKNMIFYSWKFSFFSRKINIIGDYKRYYWSSHQSVFPFFPSLSCSFFSVILVLFGQSICFIRHRPRTHNLHDSPLQHGRVASSCWYETRVIVEKAYGCDMTRMSTIDVTQWLKKRENMVNDE